jgi:integrase
MRPGEVLGLTWDRVDLDQGLITFNATDQKNRKRATIPINATARLVLQARRKFAKDHGLVSPWVICGFKGQRIMSVRKAFDKASSVAGLEDVHPHDLRRTFASWLVQNGVSIQTVSGLLRHADIQITHQIYAHLSPEQYAGATAVLDAPPRLKVIQGDVSR